MNHYNILKLEETVHQYISASDILSKPTLDNVSEHHRNPFPSSESNWSSNPMDLNESLLRGKPDKFNASKTARQPE